MFNPALFSLNKYITIVRLFIAIAVLFICGNVFAQQLTPEQQRMMKEAQAKIDSFKKANPSLAGKMPDLNSSLQQVQAMQSRSQANLKNLQNMQNQNLKNGVPVKNSTANVGILKNVNQQTVLALAQAKLQESSAKLAWDPATKSQLDKMTLDTTINSAATGVLMLLGSLPKYPGEYLISKSVLKPNPTQWAVNDLGILYRDDNQNKEALQCFLYAEQIDNQSITIKSNIGWAAAYYGDFATGKEYFNKALAINGNFGPALEGLALIAYQQGDIQGLFQALAKQITGMGGGGGGDGPSEGFSNFCGDVQQNEDIQNAGKSSKSNPNDNHTYDNKGGDDGDSQQDPPPTADAEPPTYPSARPIFVTQIEELFTIGKKFQDFQKQHIQILTQNTDLMKQKMQSLPTLHVQPYTDEQGNKIVPYSYEKFYSLFHSVHLLFEDRLSSIVDNLETESKKYLDPIFQRDMDLVNGYTKALAACQDGDKECVNRVNCEWIPRMKGSKNNDLDGIATIWNKYFDQLIDQIHWYTQSSDPFIKRVHQPGWNEYMNLVREWDVRRAILKLYSDWGSDMMSVNNSGLVVGIVTQNPNPTCFIKMGDMGGGADPFSKKTGKLKTFPDKCYREPESHDLGFASYEDNCDRTKITFSAGAFKVFREWDYSKKAKEDDTYRTGLTIGVSKSIKAGGDLGPLSTSASLKAGADITFFSEYYSNSGDRKGSGITLDLAASAGASASLQLPDDGFGGIASGYVNSNLPQVKTGTGVSAHIEFYANAGADGSLGNFNMTSATAQKY